MTAAARGTTVIETGAAGLATGRTETETERESVAIVLTGGMSTAATTRGTERGAARETMIGLLSETPSAPRERGTRKSTILWLILPSRTVLEAGLLTEESAHVNVGTTREHATPATSSTTHQSTLQTGIVTPNVSRPMTMLSKMNWIYGP